MKVLLIRPPKLNMISTNVPNVVDEETGCYPSLGLMYIAACVERYTDHQIEILDTQAEKMNYEEMKSEIRKRNPDIVGIQAMTFTLVDVILTAKIVKELDKSIPLILGGPHVNIYPEETISNSEIDFLVLGEGEYVFPDLINALSQRKDLSKIRGIVYKRNKEIINTGKREFITNLDAVPFPAYHLVPYQKYYSVLEKRTPITTMMTSRGCPFKCIFCTRPQLGKIFRYRSAENVVDEMEQCARIGIKEIFLYDDTFTINKQRVIDICNEILRRNLKIMWDIRSRVDTVDEKILKKLKLAGCERIHFGVEAGTQGILNILRKGITLQQAEKAFQWSREVGITTLAYFMIGNPTESRKQILETIKFSVKIKPDYVHIALTTLFPATELYRRGLERKILKHDYWKEFAENPRKDFVPELWEENLTREELVKLSKFAYKSFYMRPMYVLERLFEVKSWQEFKRKGRVGFRLLGM
ncbi:Anaerobic magnesium-protoporphyrin IX monomethyl ester cyclase [subsurface metagenome]|nr:radical SAM protein [Bacillota bacterium]